MMKSLLPTLALLCCALLPSARSAEAEWENFANGSRGQVTEYRGVNGTPLPACFRQPKGDGPFPAVVLLHDGA
jgi:hypothetical protein